MNINRDKIPENIQGEYSFKRKLMGEKNVKDFLKEYPSPYVTEEAENLILYYVIKSKDKQNIMKVEQKLFTDPDWLN